VAERPDVAALSVQLRGRPSDRTYHERTRLDELMAQAAAEKRQELEQLVVDRIGPLSVRLDVGEPTYDQMLINVASLVERARLGEIDEAVRVVGADLGPGLRLTYVGPLPPYRFVETEAAARA
jgi:hypothetical protein